MSPILNNARIEMKCGRRQMKKKKTLNYRFHNPNSDKAAAEYLIKIFMEANLKKVEQAMQTAMKTQ